MPHPKLTDPWFEAQFIGNISVSSPGSFRRQGASIDGAQGLFLWCPCKYGAQYPAHGLVLPFANPRGAPQVPPDFERGLARWTMTGTGLADLSLSPSVDVWRHKEVGGKVVRDGSCWHAFITAGEVTGCG